MSEEGNPAGLSSCSGGLRPLVVCVCVLGGRVCVCVCVLCGRCEGPCAPVWGRGGGAGRDVSVCGWACMCGVWAETEAEGHSQAKDNAVCVCRGCVCDCGGEAVCGVLCADGKARNPEHAHYVSRVPLGLVSPPLPFSAPTGLPSKRGPGLGSFSRADRGIGGVRPVAPPTWLVSNFLVRPASS